jgi:hypothetical protein
MTPFSIQPAMGPAAYKTFAIRAPLATHWNILTCADAGCEAHEYGWDSLIDETTGLGRRQAAYIRGEAARRFTEERQADGLTRFSFPAGQRCFAEHKTRNTRPERYVERGGDFRGNPTGERREHREPGDWQESFAAHQERLSRLAGRG